MTNNTEKLYELAGVEKYYLYTVKHIGKIHIVPLEGILENKHLFERNKKSKVKNTYINRVKKVYPPFTDTKQLELIKWLMLDSMHDELSLYFHQPTQTFVFDLYYVPEIRGCRNNRANCNTDFSQALAGLVCELWEELTPEQREEVRGILE